MLFSDRVNILTFVLACQVEDEICQVEDDVCQVEDEMHDKLSYRKCFHLYPYPFESVRYLIPRDFACPPLLWGILRGQESSFQIGPQKVVLVVLNLC